MAVCLINDWREALPYLDMHVQTLVSDILPLLNNQAGASHTISREFCSHVDYLGTLYTGTTCVGTMKVQVNRKSGLAQIQQRFVTYLQQVMGRVDSYYSMYANHIYRMCCDGPIHNFDPQPLKNETDGTTLTWLEYQGARNATLGSIEVRHLQPFLNPNVPGLYHLPVSTRCLVLDLLSSIEIYKAGLEQADDLKRRWNEAAVILSREKSVDFQFCLHHPPDRPER